jgi:hypothetical protein
MGSRSNVVGVIPANGAYTSTGSMTHQVTLTETDHLGFLGGEI